MKPSFLIAVLFAACTAQTQNLRVVPVHLEGTGQTNKSVQFFCTPDYNRDECRQHALELRRVLMTYPIEHLGMWSFALVPFLQMEGSRTSHRWIYRQSGFHHLRAAYDGHGE